MRLIKIFVLLFLCAFNGISQTFWSESFGFGCNSGQLANSVVATATNGAWAVNSLTLPFPNGSSANEWFISAKEQGQLVGNCGTGCGGSNNRTLHIGSNFTVPVTVIDPGAAYTAGPLYNTNKRAESPIINCTGRQYIQLSFSYLVQGIPTIDFCQVEYSINGGATWSVLVTIPPSYNVGCLPQGTWSFFAIGLPTSVSNNPNVKLGFHWFNNDPSGSDPSIAIDNIELSELSLNITPTVNCVSSASSASIANSAVGNNNYTWTAIPNTVTFSPVTGSATSMQYPGVGTYTINVFGSTTPTSATTSTAMNIVNVVFGTTPMVSAISSNSILCIGSSATLTAANAISYTWTSGPTNPSFVVNPSSTTVYTVTGKNGYCVSTFTLQQIVSMCTEINELGNALNSYKIYPNPFTSELNIYANEEVELTFLNSFGKTIDQINFSGDHRISTDDLPVGIYIILLKGKSESRTYRLVKEK
jgi:hypothetical protein